MGRAKANDRLMDFRGFQGEERYYVDLTLYQTFFCQLSILLAMISYMILENEGIVIIEPVSPLRQTDLEVLAKDIDSYINQKGIIKGIIIHTESFPRWDTISAFMKDMKFVRDHHHNIKRVASVTNSRLLTIVHRIAHHVLSPEIKHFAYGDLESAKKWIQEAV